MEIGDFMLFNGFERGEFTLLACVGLCDLEFRFLTLGEYVKGVFWVIGLCIVKLLKLVEVEDIEFMLVGL